MPHRSRVLVDGATDNFTCPHVHRALAFIRSEEGFERQVDAVKAASGRH